MTIAPLDGGAKFLTKSAQRRCRMREPAHDMKVNSPSKSRGSGLEGGHASWALGPTFPHRHRRPAPLSWPLLGGLSCFFERAVSSWDS